MILIAGGTGRLGSVLVRRLNASGHPVRVLTRDPAHAAHLQGLGGPPVEIVVGNVRDADAVDNAVRGADVVISAAHGLLGTGADKPATVDGDGNRNLIDSAARHGVERFVLLSGLRVGPDHPMSQGKAKYEAEQYALASGVATTIVRPTAYAELWLHIMGDTLLSKGTAQIFGRGHNPINFVSVEDVAALIESAMTDPSLRGATIDIGGPDNVSQLELVQLVADSTGTPLKVKHIPLPAMRMMSVLLKAVKPAVARQIQAGVVIDTTDRSLDPAEFRRRFPSIPLTPLADVAAQEFAAGVR